MQENALAKKEKIVFFVKTVLLFFFLYDVVFMGVPTRLSTRKVTFVIFVIWSLFLFFFGNVRKDLFEYIPFRKAYIGLVLVTGLSIPYTIFRARFHGVLDTDGVEYPCSVYFLLFCMIGTMALLYVYRSREEFCRSVMFVTFAQSIFVLLEFKIAPFKDFLMKVVDDSNSNIRFNDDKRAVCLGASGSMATVMLAFGVWITGWYIITQAEAIKRMWLCWVIFALGMLAEFLCGKTGFYLSIVNLIIVLSMYLHRIENTSKAWRNIGIVFGGFGVLFGLWYGFYGSKVYEIKEKFRHVFNLTVEFGDGKASFWTRFNEGQIPPLSLDVIFGLGIFRGDANNGLSIHHDGGYIQRFVAEGWIFAALEYVLLILVLALLIYQVESVKGRIYFSVLSVLLLIVEFKEPFIYKYGPLIILMAALMIERSVYLEGYEVSFDIRMKIRISSVERNLLIKKIKRGIKYHSQIAENEKKIEYIFNNECKTLRGAYMSMDERLQWQKALMEFNKYKPEEAVIIAEHFMGDNVKLEKSFYNISKIPEDEPVLLCNVRDDLEKIKNVIEHHRNMGVKYFAILDNGSTDGTFEYLMSQEIDVFSVKEQYTSVVRAAWMMKIASYYGFNRWYVVLDSDELLVYPSGKTQNINEIIGDLKKQGIDRGLGMMVDMYAEESDLKKTVGSADLIKKYRFFDKNTYEISDGIFTKEIFGGPRTRMFGIADGTNRELLTKFPVFYWKRGEIYRYHYLFPFVENFKSPLVLALMHYKFTDGDYEKLQRIVKEGNYAANSKLYENYVNKLPEDGRISFMYPQSEEMKDPSDLMKIEIMRKCNGQRRS